MPNWAEYLEQFHAARAGITEEVLARAVSGEGNPYRWLARTVSSSAKIVLDLGCGSGAMSRVLEKPGRTIIGFDISPTELEQAVSRSDGPFVLADALKLPVQDGAADAVTSSMGLAVIHPTETLLQEISRVLRPGGVFSALVPTWRPLSAGDVRVGSALAGVLGTPPRFPAALEISIATTLRRHGLRKVEDARERYHFVVESELDAELLINALYLPSSGDRRLKAGVELLVSDVDAKGSVAVPIPMRRIVALK